MDEFQNLPIASLKESPMNPRRSYDAKQMEDLERNVRAVGKILVPLLVRRNGTGKSFEILAGSRRLRVAAKLGLAELPCRVMTGLSDAQALEVMIIENLQRADVHPLEEADGYRELMKAGDYDVNAVAAKIGKSPSYVYQRLKLGELTARAKKAFIEGEISAGHAILIARLAPKDQEGALEACVDSFRALSVHELGDWIKSEFHLELDSAPWKKDDATLVAAAGACTTCPKRSGAMPLHEGEAKNFCTDRDCFKRKLDTFIARRLIDLTRDGVMPVQIATDWGREKGVYDRNSYHRVASKADRCEHAQLGLVVRGNIKERGQSFDVCVARDCKKHRSRFSSQSASESAASKQKRAGEQN
jgi:ParB family chromosome partitioning protein